MPFPFPLQKEGWKLDTGNKNCHNRLVIFIRTGMHSAVPLASLDSYILQHWVECSSCWDGGDLCWWWFCTGWDAELGRREPSALESPFSAHSGLGTREGLIWSEVLCTEGLCLTDVHVLPLKSRKSVLTCINKLFYFSFVTQYNFNLIMMKEQKDNNINFWEMKCICNVFNISTHIFLDSKTFCSMVEVIKKRLIVSCPPWQNENCRCKVSFFIIKIRAMQTTFV